MELSGGGKTHGNELAGLSQNFIRLGLADALDGQDLLLRGVGDGLNRVEPSLLEFAAVMCANAAGLMSPRGTKRIDK